MAWKMRIKFPSRERGLQLAGVMCFISPEQAAVWCGGYPQAPAEGFECLHG